ncbi:G2 and S phase-expressed protein 1 isoform X2 [Dunckerocampus dactyliophorus]|uniref:G2 and S phase-expressed protein 1 isoform X2 n=1 Tax=Dunckerocampus dactyliophorus TaxID=161453 RepID=UPI00240682BD|nr:G2 and S phase-expressed protein 1 isoform X2 [Dunckerocampus dactyliophorus]
MRSRKDDLTAVVERRVYSLILQVGAFVLQRRSCREMDRRANTDVISLLDEKFDFDVSLSPESSRGEDEDDVFLEPSSQGVEGAPVNLVSRLEEVTVSVRTSWSPLSGDQLDAVCQEAHRLADQLQSSKLQKPTGVDKVVTSTDGEHFIQGTEAKLGVLAQHLSMCSPVKRQTFLVQDSPMKDLPPAIQRRLQRGSSTASSGRPAHSTTPSTRLSTRLSTCSPASAAKTRTALRGKAMLGAVLPSKLAAPKTSCSASKSAAERSQIQPISKMAPARKLSPSPGPTYRAQSCEDLQSDSASVASDVSDSSLNSSIVGKRTLALPTKVVRNQSGLKAPPLQNRRVTEKSNTSSSSSSVSSFNSSKLNSSLNRNLSTSTGNVSRPVNQAKRRSGLGVAADPSSSTTSRRTLSSQARRTSEAEHVKAARSTPQRKAETTAPQPLSSMRTLEKTKSVPTVPAASARIQSRPKEKPKPQASAPPTPSRGPRGVSSPDVSKVLKPKRLISVASMDSLPEKAFAGPLTPPAGGSGSPQLKQQRPSALPTPLKRRMSAIAMVTPTNHGRITRTPAASNSGYTSRSSGSAAHTDSIRADPVDIQCFSLEEEEPPADPLATDPRANQTEVSAHSQSELSKELIELETHKLIPEVLLLDLPAPTLQPHEKLLIDLSNTPDLIRTGGKCSTSTQLIDLSSPLIKWSPEDKKENNAPLINLSF